MKKTCKQCEKEINGKPKMYDDYYFCKEGDCLKIYLEELK